MEVEAEDDKQDNTGWYSSDEDEEEDKNKKSIVQEMLRSISKVTGGDDKNSDSNQSGTNSPSSNNPSVDKKPDFSSVLSAIRQSVQASSASSVLSGASTSTSNSLTDSLSSSSANIVSSSSGVHSSPSETNASDASKSTADVDFRFPAVTTARGGNSTMPFGDTDFRLPPLRPNSDLQDVDLRLTASPPVSSTPSLLLTNALFRNMPSAPATEINASITNHPPITWFVRLVAGVGKPNYSQLRATMPPSQILMDPRLGTNRGTPATPPSPTHGSSESSGLLPSPKTDTVMMDPRVRGRSAAATASSSSLIPQGQSSPAQSSKSLIPPQMMPQDSRFFR